MANLKDFNNPSFVMYPFYTDRTAWREFGLPMILVIPHIRDNAGYTMLDAGVQNVSIYVAEKGKTPVAGHDHVGIFIPDFDIYRRNISNAELSQRLVPMQDVEYLDAGEQSTDEAHAVYIRFTTRSGVIDKIAYLRHADYIDLSDILIPTEHLPTNRYYLTYEAQYFARTISSNNELLCIDTSKLITAKFRFLMNHPGEVLLMMVEGTPELYFTGKKRSEDTTIAFYRPFSEILQDIHDEQNYLERVNWVYDIPPENVPYLGFILGWELPYFPQSVDNLRRAVLRNIVKLQRLKGSRRAVKELFDLFGFAVNIANVWWTPDGKHFVAPGESAGGYTIPTNKIATTEPLLLEFVEDGFGQTNVPLINSPLDDLTTVRAYVVQRGSDAHTYLQQVGNDLSTDFASLDYNLPGTFSTLPSAVSAVESMSGLIGASTALIGADGFISTITTTGDAPLFKTSLKRNKITNVVDITLSKYYQFNTDGTALYIFATYGYNKISIPQSMDALQSNRFDVEITAKSGEQVDPSVILFLIDFLFRIKAFHSLLRKVIIAILAHDTYQTTDWCIGGLVQQSITTDAGKQQTPPEAIIPRIPAGNCIEYTPEDYGYRRWDIDYRNRVLADLAIEFDAWKYYGDNIAQPPLPDCGANPNGQDRTTDARTQQTTLNNAIRSDEDASRNTLCTLNGSNYCYEGRPRDRISYELDLPLNESWQFKACGIGLGRGVYYTYNAPGFLGNPITNLYVGHQSVPSLYNSWMGHLYRAYGRNQAQSLHFQDQPGLDSSNIQSKWLALKRPSLGIQKDNLNFPGHRLPSMAALYTDFQHSAWKLKPWDFPIECNCGKVKYPNPLHATLETDTSGNQHLVFDDAAYTLTGNSILPDIYSLGEHRVGTETAVADADDITHSIYGSTVGGHPAISLQGITESVGVIEVADLGFESATNCGSSISDYSDGYPSTTGWIADTGTSTVYFPASPDPALLASQWDMPGPSTGEQLLFTLSSEIRIDPSDYEFDLYRPMRLDCGCLKLVCGDTDASESILACNMDTFISTYGNAENDQVEIDQYMVMGENQHTDYLDLNENLPLFYIKQIETSAGWVMAANGHAGPTPWPVQGAFSYKDSYDTIYEVYWETVNNYLDLVVITKEPRVWGTSYKVGRIVNKEVYRTGIITTTRQIYVYDGDDWQLLASGYEQIVGEFKSTYLCNPPYVDPFVQHLDHNIQDGTTHYVMIGSHWTSDITSEDSEWTDPASPTAGGEPLLWIDVFA